MVDLICLPVLTGSDQQADGLAEFIFTIVLHCHLTQTGTCPFLCLSLEDVCRGGVGDNVDGDVGEWG